MLVALFNAVKVESVPLNSNYFSGSGAFGSEAGELEGDLQPASAGESARGLP